MLKLWIVVVVLGTSLSAQSPPPKVYGIGVEACANWLTQPTGKGIDVQLQAATQRLAVIAWATGYITGAAAVLAPRGVLLGDTTGRDIEAALTTHCKANSTATIDAALVRSLTP